MSDMIFDIKKIAPKAAIKISGELCIAMPKDFGAGDMANCEISGILRENGGIYNFCADILANLQTVCSCCLCDMPIRLEIQAEQAFAESDYAKADEDDIIIISDNEIRISDAISAAIFPNIPMRPICSPDCRGLCPKCGIDLNDSHRDCDDGNVNEEYAAMLSGIVLV